MKGAGRTLPPETAKTTTKTDKIYETTIFKWATGKKRQRLLREGSK